MRSVNKVEEQEEFKLKRDSQLEKILASSMKNININLHESKDQTDQNIKSALLSAATKMYKETKDEAYKTFVANTLNNIIENGNIRSVLSLMSGDALFFVYDTMEDERYKDIICELAHELMETPKNKEGVFVGGDGTRKAKLSDAYEQLQFYMNYETRFGGKEHYNDVVKQFKAIRDAQICEDTGLYSEESERDIALFLAALIDTMEVTDQPVYEIFAGLKEIYKEAFAGICNNGQFQTDNQDFVNRDNITERLILDYALMKGCRMKAILTSKYEREIDQLTKQVFDIVKEEGKDGFKNQYDMLAAAMMAYAECLKERSYQVYGRNKGGAIWS